MGKKHTQPIPIDIFNAPSPRTMLSGGGMKRARGESARSTAATVTSATTPTGGVSAFPESPPPETIEDYGDEAAASKSADSEAFSSQGDDGNAQSSEDASDFDEEDDEFEEGDGDDEESDDPDDVDDDVDATHITVDFEAVEMEEDDVDAVMHLMDQFIPDHMNEVDRSEFGAALASEPATTLITLGSDGDGEDGKEVYGIVSLLDVAHAIHARTSSCMVALLKLLKDGIWSVVAPGIAPYDLLGSLTPDKKAKAMLVISEHIRNVPLEMVSRLLSFTFENFEQETKRLGPSGTVAFPCMLVMVVKVQRDAEKAAALAKLEKKELQKQKKGGAAKGVAPAASKGHRSEASGGGSAQVVLHIDEDFIFWREEDSILYHLRDKRVAVHAYRCRAQYDNQPEPERPVSLAFALSMESFQRGLREIKKREALKPL